VFNCPICKTVRYEKQNDIHVFPCSCGSFIAYFYTDYFKINFYHNSQCLTAYSGNSDIEIFYSDDDDYYRISDLQVSNKFLDDMIKIKHLESIKYILEK
jgi:hypothetical protein